MKRKIIQDVVFNLIKQAVIYLPKDVKERLKNAYNGETNSTSKTQLRAILENIKLAERHQVPLCQDTGTMIFYIKAGAKVKNLDIIEEEVIKATRKATLEVPLRPNAVNPITQKNSGDNIGRYIPNINWEIVPGGNLELTVMAKGGGSENVCAQRMLSPSEGLKGLKKFIVDTIIQAGAKPCPPTILGIAIGGGADISMKLAKKALLRPLNQPNPNPKIEKFENEIYQAANMTGIGVMGLGGGNTVLGVNIEYAYRHPASYPVAIAFNCWASRRASALINNDNTIVYLTKK